MLVLHLPQSVFQGLCNSISSQENNFLFCPGDLYGSQGSGRLGRMVRLGDRCKNRILLAGFLSAITRNVSRWRCTWLSCLRMLRWASLKSWVEWCKAFWYAVNSQCWQDANGYLDLVPSSCATGLFLCIIIGELASRVYDLTSVKSAVLQCFCWPWCKPSWHKWCPA